MERIPYERRVYESVDNRSSHAMIQSNIWLALIAEDGHNMSEEVILDN